MKSLAQRRILDLLIPSPSQSCPSQIFFIQSNRSIADKRNAAHSSSSIVEVRIKVWRRIAKGLLPSTEWGPSPVKWNISTVLRNW
ncbi:unnamed protein product [Linum trigynum]|uniref:Uncharacterized protein n=1 Tax=Linum trigynum TaxID=586398 RepID=A0AAV2F6M8_9ROSI